VGLTATAPVRRSTPVWWHSDHVEVVMTRIVDSGELGGSRSRSQEALVSCSWMIQSPPAAAFL
jgi:hypothetical protein